MSDIGLKSMPTTRVLWHSSWSEPEPVVITPSGTPEQSSCSGPANDTAVVGADNKTDPEPLEHKIDEAARKTHKTPTNFLSR
jgi:hypothetical protein